MLPNIDVLTPDDASMVAGITAFRLRGHTSAADNDAIVSTLLKQHGVYTVRRTGPAAGDCVRVTPALHTTRADLERLLGGLRALTGDKSQYQRPFTHTHSLPDQFQ